MGNIKSIEKGIKFAENIASHKYMCCKITTIKNVDFICGHVKPEIKGGHTEIDNLRPICSGCNGSMGIKDMIIFDLIKQRNKTSHSYPNIGVYTKFYIACK